MAHVEAVGKTSSLLKCSEGAGNSPSGGISSAPVKNASKSRSEASYSPSTAVQQITDQSAQIEKISNTFAILHEVKKKHMRLFLFLAFSSTFVRKFPFCKEVSQAI